MSLEPQQNESFDTSNQCHSKKDTTTSKKTINGRMIEAKRIKDGRVMVTSIAVGTDKFGNPSECIGVECVPMDIFIEVYGEDALPPAISMSPEKSPDGAHRAEKSGE